MSPEVLLASQLPQVSCGSSSCVANATDIQGGAGGSTAFVPLKFNFVWIVSQMKEHKLTKESCGLHTIGGGVDTLFYCGYQRLVIFRDPGCLSGYLVGQALDVPVFCN